MKTPSQTPPHTPIYEILDSMEITVATADSFDDAMYAAEKHRPAMVYNTSTRKVVYFTGR